MLSDNLIKVIVDDVIDTLDIWGVYKPPMNKGTENIVDEKYELELKKEIDLNVKKAIETYLVTHPEEDK